MKISELADLVAVRNHISIIIGDKSVCSKDDVRPLNDARIKLDKKFLAELRDVDVEGLFSHPITFNAQTSAVPMITLSTKTVENTVSQANEQLTLGLSSQDGIWEDADTTPDIPDEYNESVEPSPEAEEAEDDDEAAELALIAERVKAQKEQLKKEGRSNKRKPKEDGAAK